MLMCFSVVLFLPFLNTYTHFYLDIKNQLAHISCKNMSSVEPATAVMNTFSMKMSIKFNVQLHAFIHLLEGNTCVKMHFRRYVKYGGKRLRDF